MTSTTEAAELPDDPELTGTGEDTSAALLELVAATPSVETYLGEVVAMAAALSPDLAGCGVTARLAGGALTVAASNDLVATVDEVQYGLGAGPCLDTLRSGAVVDVPSMADAEGWDGYPEHALRHGVRSSFCLPLTVGDRTVAALNAYGAEPGIFTGDLIHRLADFAARAQIALAVAVRSAEQARLLEQLHTAMQSRSTIDQAMGILMARERCSATEAFAILRTASQSRNRRLADIAAELITATTGEAPQPGRFRT